MTMTRLRLPAVSREMEFVATHAEEVNDILDGYSKIDPALFSLSKAVSERANKDVEELLDRLKDTLEQGVDGLLRINNWHRPRWEWELYSEIYSGARGRKKRIGWAGLRIGSGKERFRLIGFMNPRRGGLDGQKKLALACKKKIKQVHLTRDEQKRYPGWDDNVIWFEKKLKLGTSLQELEQEVRKQTKTFFRLARPFLTGN
jgi:hypothetical protein